MRRAGESRLQRSERVPRPRRLCRVVSALSRACQIARGVARARRTHASSRAFWCTIPGVGRVSAWCVRATLGSVWVAASAASCDGESIADTSDLCQTCETDDDCAAVGTGLACRPSETLKRCTVDCSQTPCPDGFECSLVGPASDAGQDGGQGSLYGFCSPRKGTCANSPGACEKAASEIRADADSHGVAAPCAEPISSRYVNACEKLREVCGGSCADLCGP